MTKDQLTLVMKYTPVVYAGTFIRSMKHGNGVVEAFKGFAKDIWNQPFVYVNCAQSDIDEVSLMLQKTSKDEPIVYFFDELEKANEEFRNFLFLKFSLNRDETISDKSRVFYNLYPVNDPFFMDNWNDWVMVHGCHFKFE